jgi:hypothetical protein
MATNPTAMPTTMTPGTASRSLTILNPPVRKATTQEVPSSLKSKSLIRSRVYFELLPWPRSNKMFRRRQRQGSALKCELIRQKLTLFIFESRMACRNFSSARSLRG